MRDFDINDGPRRPRRQGLRQAAGDLGAAQGGKSRDIAEALAFEMFGEGTQAGKLTHQRAAAGAHATPAGEEAAQIRRLDVAQRRELWRGAEMLAQKVEELG